MKKKQPSSILSVLPVFFSFLGCLFSWNEIDAHRSFSLIWKLCRSLFTVLVKCSFHHSVQFFYKVLWRFNDLNTATEVFKALWGRKISFCDNNKNLKDQTSLPFSAELVLISSQLPGSYCCFVHLPS